MWAVNGPLMHSLSASFPLAFVADSRANGRRRKGARSWGWRLDSVAICVPSGNPRPLVCRNASTAVFSVFSVGSCFADCNCTGLSMSRLDFASFVVDIHNAAALRPTSFWPSYQLPPFHIFERAENHFQLLCSLLAIHLSTNQYGNCQNIKENSVNW